MLLPKIGSPSDLKKLNDEELEGLAREIRQELIQTVAENGGHLASNLGIVELTLALHRVFDLPDDKIIYDVGHQCYVHKMITGRYGQFSTLRQYGGISGFPKRAESPYDCYETGHASTAISAALGMARARDMKKEHFQVIAVVGDGALTGGMCYEALNDAGNSRTKLIVVLNDNEMSIAPNVGALSKYLTNLRISAGWQRAKKRVRHLSDIPVIGTPTYRVIHGTKKIIKTVLVRSTDVGFFEALGFQYFGPINGHDLKSLESTLEKARKTSGPCVIHVLTKKGFGYEKAEKKPEKFHGTPPFYIETGDRIKAPENPSCGHVMADTLAEMAAYDARIVAITAAMKLGTGLDHLEEKFPDRVMDVGIAEEHAAVMAAGLAAEGMRPYFAVYASFFQRCHDQMIHDICMQRLPVVFLLDRSGIGGEDGQTHHGVFDFASLIPVPHMTVLAPCDSTELQKMIRWTVNHDGPVAIRYAKDGEPLQNVTDADRGFIPGKWETLREGRDVTLLAVGSMVRKALAVAEQLEKRKVFATVMNCSTVKPLDEDFLSRLSSGQIYFTMEEHMITGGFGMFVTEYCLQHGRPVPSVCFGVPDQFIQHGNHEQLLRDAGLHPDQMTEKILEKIKVSRK